jgi:hypothetical protein
MIILKIILILSLLIVLWQDVKSREVYWFLFPIIGGCCGFLYFFNSMPELFLISLFMNLIFVSILLLVIYLYSKYKLKSSLKTSIGSGDILLFLALCLSFSSVSFITCFVLSLTFSLVLHLFIQKRDSIKTVPLAGYMSLFFVLVYLGSWTGLIDSLYII